MKAFALCFLGLFYNLNINAIPPPNQDPRLNHLQMKGTHNSYHLSNALTGWTSFGYDHAPLNVQLSDQGVRQFEFDLHQCGSGDFCVYHIGFIDSGTSCDMLRQCLSEIRDWSNAHKDHHPIFIFLEPKEDAERSQNPKFFGTIEKQISEVFPRKDLLIPDDVRGSYFTLKEAIVNNSWPKIDDVRGKIVFVLLDEAKHRENYGTGRSSLQDRLMFTTSSPQRDDAAIVKVDDPVKNASYIRSLVEAGFIVRTRADADLSEAKEGDYNRLQSALQSGAQIISTDFPGKIEAYDYWVDIPNGTPSRCNPVTAFQTCRPEQIENLDL